jgi:hypothetical protein
MVLQQAQPMVAAVRPQAQAAVTSWPTTLLLLVLLLVDQGGCLHHHPHPLLHSAGSRSLLWLLRRTSGKLQARWWLLPVAPAGAATAPLQQCLAAGVPVAGVRHRRALAMLLLLVLLLVVVVRLQGLGWALQLLLLVRLLQEGWVPVAVAAAC